MLLSTIERLDPSADFKISCMLFGIMRLSSEFYNHGIITILSSHLTCSCSFVLQALASPSFEGAPGSY